VIEERISFCPSANLLADFSRKVRSWSKEVIGLKREKKRTQAVCKPLYLAIFCALVFFQLGFVTQAAAGETGKGGFFLVSVGVGDPDLITVRAIDTIAKSDIVICRKETWEELATYLKGKEFLDISRAGWRTYGKDCSEMEDREARSKCEKDRKSRGELIVEIRAAINAGKTVAVLGSGDLLLYGGPYRWYLKEFADLQPGIIPGVSCFNAANAALRTDVAAGKETRGVVLTTIQEIEKLSQGHPTMVIFTMFTKFGDLVAKLRTLYPLETPIAIVFYAGYKDKERVVKGTLDTILEQVRGEEFPFEHLVYVGDFLK
jgi:precorrin-4/cobalt-precorrin-4 C11-methyltransferase